MNAKSYTIYHDFPINANVEKVFDAISKPEDLINWWPLKCVGERAINAVYNFNFTDTYNWFGKVVCYEPNKAFHIKMIQSSDNWNPTSFGFDLEIIDSNTTLVHFWHINWQHCNAEFKQSSYCWAMLLNGLKNYIENGIVIPFEERE